MSQYFSEQSFLSSISVLDNLENPVSTHFLEKDFFVDKIAMKWLTSLLTEAELDPELEELVQKVLKQTKGLRNNDLSFGPLFPEERTYFPVSVNVDEELIEKMGVPREISEYLASKELDVEDYRQGLAFSKKNPSRKIRIGKVLTGQAQLKKMFDKRLAGEIKKPKKLLAVFTYNPRDIATMSTGRGWSSCANLDPKSKYGRGEAADQIPDKIIQGGMVAYLINEDDKDIERPIARISIRRLVSLNDGSFILLPENICYGAQVDEFTEVVSEVLEKSNEQTSDDEFGIFKDAEGGYSDTFKNVMMRSGDEGFQEILNYYMDEMTDAIESEDDDTIKNLTDQIRSILQEYDGEEDIDIEPVYKNMNKAIELDNLEAVEGLNDIVENMKAISSNISSEAYDNIDMESIITSGNIGIYDELFSDIRGVMLTPNFQLIITAINEIIDGQESGRNQKELGDLNEMIQRMLFQEESTEVMDIIYEISNASNDEIQSLKFLMKQLQEKLYKGSINPYIDNDQTYIYTELRKHILNSELSDEAEEILSDFHWIQKENILSDIRILNNQKDFNDKTSKEIRTSIYDELQENYEKNNGWQDAIIAFDSIRYHIKELKTIGIFMEKLEELDKDAQDQELYTWLVKIIQQSDIVDTKILQHYKKKDK